MDKPIIIGFDGGPLSGKSSTLNYLRNQFTKHPIRGYRFIFAEEAATKLFQANPTRSGGTIDFQLDVMKLQLQDIGLAKAAAAATSDTVVLIADRSLISGLAVYMPEEYRKLFDYDELSLLYDALFYFDSAVDFANDTKNGNCYRKESSDEIRLLAKQTRSALLSHHNFIGIPVFDDIRAKYSYVESKILDFINNTSAKSEEVA